MNSGKEGENGAADDSSEVIRVRTADCEGLPVVRSGPSGQRIGGQLLRSGTSIGANVEEAQAAQTKPDSIAKMSIARKEARETLYWLKLLDSEGLLLSASADELLRECDSIVATLTAIVKTSQLRRNESK